MNYGLALSGGGTRGAAHVGVLKALNEAALMQAAGAWPVIAVDISSGYTGISDGSIVEVLSHSFSITSGLLEEYRPAKESFLLKPPLPAGAGLLTFDKMEECVEAAYQYTMEMIPEIREVLLRARA